MITASRKYTQQKRRQLRATVTRSWASLTFWLVYPFALIAYKWNRQQEWLKIVPRLWLSQAEILARDLALYDQKKEIDLDFVKDFAEARDATLATIKKQLLLSTLIFLFLLANYFSVGLDINLGGFSLKNTPGVPEGLLLCSNLLTCYTLMLQGNVYVLDAAIKFAIANALPEELQRLYLIRYFPHEHVGEYFPFNVPHITPTKLTSKIKLLTFRILLVLMAVTATAFVAANTILLFHYLWFNPKFGIWSYVLLAYLLLCSICAALYVLTTRIRLPYRDWTTNHEMELLEQVDPQRHRQRLQEVYGKLNELEAKMEARRLSRRGKTELRRL